MLIREAFIAIQDLSKAHPVLFEDVDVELALADNLPCIGDWSAPDKLGMLVTGDGIGTKSGLYFFASLSCEILYIGKATKSNLHHRVWDHVKTPEVLENGWRTFPKHGLCSDVEEDPHESDVLNGQIRLGVVTISDPDVVSLAEVYLQTLHQKRHGRLPVFNKQVG